VAANAEAALITLSAKAPNARLEILFMHYLRVVETIRRKIAVIGL
jgi:hypothetical protein